MMADRRAALSLLAGGLLGSEIFGPVNGAQAQQPYPSSTVTIELPLAPGSGADALVRIYAEALQAVFGQPFVVRNAPGAALMLASIDVARAAPDGLTLLMTVTSTLAINQTLYKEMAYDPINGFAPIAIYTKSPFSLVVGADSPLKTPTDLLTAARANPGKMNYSSQGVGSMQHLAMEMVMNRFGLVLNHVPYRNTQQQITDIAADNVDTGFVEAAASQGLIRAGKLRPLAVSSSTRSTIFPDVPTIAEAFDAPGLEAVSWHALLAPAGTPRSTIERLHDAMVKITTTADFRQKATALGLLPIDAPSLEDTQKYIIAERAKWDSLIRKIGLAGTQ